MLRSNNKSVLDRSVVVSLMCITIGCVNVFINLQFHGCLVGIAMRFIVGDQLMIVVAMRLVVSNENFVPERNEIFFKIIFCAKM